MTDDERRIEFLVRALAKLPSVRGIVWRGVPEPLSTALLVSTPIAVSHDPRVASENFTAPVLLVIVSATGRDVGAIAQYPDEQEVALLPRTVLVPKSGAGAVLGTTIQLVEEHVPADHPAGPVFADPQTGTIAWQQALQASLDAPNFHVTSPGKYTGALDAVRLNPDGTTS